MAVPGALQHVVLYGPRGIGKSFIARPVQIECAELAEERGLPMPFVLLPEEQHNLTRNPHALPAYIAHRLADWRTGEDRTWQGAMFQWPDPDQEARQWEAACERLEQELDRALPAGAHGGSGMAIVVVENFDILLANVFKGATAEQRLRKWLDRPDNRLMLIATATGSVDMDYDRPLFQAFQSIRSRPGHRSAVSPISTAAVTPRAGPTWSPRWRPRPVPSPSSSAATRAWPSCSPKCSRPKTPSRWPRP